MMGRSLRAQAWQHLGRKGLLGKRRPQAPRPAAPGTSLCLGRGRRPAGAPGDPGPSPGLPRTPCPLPPPVARPALHRSAASASGLRGCVPAVSPDGPPAPPRPQSLPHLHARSPGVNPSVQDSDEHPPAVILWVATEEGGGPGLFLGQEAVEGEGLLGGGGGHGRRLEDEEEANCQAARGRAARGHPGGRGPGRG